LIIYAESVQKAKQLFVFNPAPGDTGPAVKGPWPGCQLKSVILGKFPGRQKFLFRINLAEHITVFVNQYQIADETNSYANRLYLIHKIIFFMMACILLCGWHAFLIDLSFFIAKGGHR
jgi:hypothetical protein